MDCLRWSCELDGVFFVFLFFPLLVCFVIVLFSVCLCLSACSLPMWWIKIYISAVRRWVNARAFISEQLVISTQRRKFHQTLVDDVVGVGAEDELLKFKRSRPRPVEVKVATRSDEQTFGTPTSLWFRLKTNRISNLLSLLLIIEFINRIYFNSTSLVGT